MTTRAALHFVEADETPAHLKGYNRLIWLRRNNPHLWLHEEVRLAKQRVSAKRREWGEHSTRHLNELELLAEYEKALDEYHAEHP